MRHTEDRFDLAAIYSQRASHIIKLRGRRRKSAAVQNRQGARLLYRHIEIFTGDPDEVGVAHQPVLNAWLLAWAYEVISDADFFRLESGELHAVLHLKRARVYLVDIDAGFSEGHACAIQVDLKVAQRIVRPGARVVHVRGGPEKGEKRGAGDFEPRGFQGGTKCRAADWRKQNDACNQQIETSH